jgi:hypothetical protein
MAWQDADVVWLTGLHAAESHSYFNKEAYERVLWWNHLPQLIAIAEKDPAAKLAGTRAAIRDLERANATAAADAHAAGYRLDQLLAPRQSTAHTRGDEGDGSMKKSETISPLKEPV